MHGSSNLQSFFVSQIVTVHIYEDKIAEYMF